MIFFPAGRSSTSIPASSSSSPSPPSTRGLDEPQPAVAAGKQRRRNLLEVPRHRLECLREAALHRLGELVSELRDLGERGLEILPLGAELVEALLLGLVLLLGERIDLAELLATRVEPIRARRELAAVVALRRGLGAGQVEAALRLFGLRLEACELDLHGRRALVRVVGLPARLDLVGAEAPQLLSEAGRPLRARIDTRPNGRLEPSRQRRGLLEARTESDDGIAEPAEHVRVERRAPRRHARAAPPRRPEPCRRRPEPPSPPRRRAASSDDASAWRSSLATVSSVERLAESATEPGHDDLCLLRARDGVRGLTGGFGLECREAPELGTEGACLLCAEGQSRGQRLLQRDRGAARTRECLLQRGHDLDQPAEQRRVDRSPAQVRDLGERRLRPRRSLSRLGCSMSRRGRSARELGSLVGERPPPGIHLEQHRLRRLAGEPELAALRVVAVTLGRDHRSMGGFEQAVGIDEPDSVEQAQRGGSAGHQGAEWARALDRRLGGVPPARGRR